MRKWIVALVLFCIAAFTLVMTRGEELAGALDQVGPAHDACIVKLKTSRHNTFAKNEGTKCRISWWERGECRWLEVDGAMVWNSSGRRVKVTQVIRCLPAPMYGHTDTLLAAGGILTVLGAGALFVRRRRLKAKASPRQPDSQSTERR
jgi:LPXTG-motif cell wall-anchored protein